MKPCPKHREKIASMAMSLLEIRHEPELCAHIESCASCRSYLEDIAKVAGSLRGAEPQSDIRPSALFHRNVVVAVAMAKCPSALETIIAQIWSRWNWRLIVPTAAATVVVIAACLIAKPPAGVQAPINVASQPVANPDLNTDVEPTFMNYEMAAHQSLDKLDELLTEQGNRNQAAPPTYAAALSRLSTAD